MKTFIFLIISKILLAYQEQLSTGQIRVFLSSCLKRASMVKMTANIISSFYSAFRVAKKIVKFSNFYVVQ